MTEYQPTPEEQRQMHYELNIAKITSTAEFVLNRHLITALELCQWIALAGQLSDERLDADSFMRRYEALKAYASREWEKKQSSPSNPPKGHTMDTIFIVLYYDSANQSYTDVLGAYETEDLAWQAAANDKGVPYPSQFDTDQLTNHYHVIPSPLITTNS